MSDETAKAGSAAGPAFAAAERLPDEVALWLVRHGETEWSASGRHTGRTDLPLTAAGEQQARALLPMLSDLSPALVLSSPRHRALHTAELAGLHRAGRCGATACRSVTAGRRSSRSAPAPTACSSARAPRWQAVLSYSLPTDTSVA
jgi:hypothetical protein